MAKITNIMTVDVEDYFQVSAFERHISRDDWNNLPCRVAQNTNRILDLFAENRTKATFFTLGWVAERYPELIRRIVEEGHELASHGYDHRRVTDLTPEEFRQDLIKSSNILEQIGGVKLKGYRAPSYSIVKSNQWAHDILAECGFIYSSSVYPVKHDHYGIPDAPRFKYEVENIELTEFPITTIRRFGKNYPAGGGGFFRLYPYWLTQYAINQVNQQDSHAAIFYFHPWEIDPDQPKIAGLSLKTRFRHYLNLKRTEKRLKRLLNDYSWGRMDEKIGSNA
jgi:polysaccharide deacetylase family protein (PEP-CTERM system associated)